MPAIYCTRTRVFVQVADIIRWHFVANGVRCTTVMMMDRGDARQRRGELNLSHEEVDDVRQRHKLPSHSHPLAPPLIFSVK